MECHPIKQPFQDAFAADTDLEGYLKDSILSLKTSLGQDNDTQARPNICNEARVINIATIYLGQALGVSLSTIIESYTYVSSAAHVFPNSSRGPWKVFIPDNEPNFPDLEQIYWTILDQFTPTSEPTIREDKSPLWCFYVGRAVYDHCRNTKSSKSCSVDNCKNIWTYFVEACHRVRSINTTDGDYKVTNDVNRWCLWIPHSDYKAYFISRRYQKSQMFFARLYLGGPGPVLIWAGI